MRPMKDSGVEWLGEVPEEWSIEPLWAHFKRRKETGFPNEALLSVYRDHGVVLKASRDDNHNVESQDLGGYQLVRRDSLVINKMKAWQGSVSISDLQGIVSPAYFVYSSSSAAFDRMFVHYLLRSAPYIISYSLISKGVRTGQWDLQPEYLRQTQLLIPPIEEQKNIGKFIDQETSQIDQLISKKEQLIEKLLERRQALITQAVTKGLDPNVPMKDSGVEWLGDVPLHWSIRPLRSIASTISSPVDKKSIEGQSSVLLCNYTDVTYNDLIHADINFMQATATLAQIRGYKLKAGDTVITKDSETAEDMGLSAFVVAELSNVLCGYHLAIVRPRKRVVPRWLTWNLRGSSSRTQMTLFSRGLTRVSLGQGSLRSIKVATPPADEQTIIASFLDQETAQIDLLVEKARKAIELLKERRQALITQVVTGKIDVRGFAGGNS